MPNNNYNLNNQAQDSSQKILWKHTLLEFLHNYFIGISHLACSQEDCLLIDSWDKIEAKLSKKGKCALVKITKDKYLVADLLTYEVNGLEELTKVTLQFRDGSQYLVRTRAEKEELLKNLRKEEKHKLKFWKPEEVVYFVNNSSLTANLVGAETIYLDDLWKIKEDIKWDREKSKKKVFLFTENESSEQTQGEKIGASEKDYLFYIADPSITNSIKNYEVYSPGTGTQERQQLHQDYKEEFSELRRVYGIRHLTSKKEDRQNNPEIELNEAQFIALERRKKRIREKSIKEAILKDFCKGEHTLTYGTSPEQREEKVQEVEQLKEIEESKKETEKQEIYERKH